MSILAAFAVAGAATYVLRIAFIVLTTPDRLPERVQAGLPYIGPAAMAALATASLVKGLGGAAGAPATLTAFAAAIALSRWRGSMPLTVVGAIAVAWLTQLVV